MFESVVWLLVGFALGYGLRESSHGGGAVKQAEPEQFDCNRSHQAISVKVT
jgi:hypothetical protein